MARQTIQAAVVDTLAQMGVTDVQVRMGGRHPQIMWRDAQSGRQGIITVPGTSGDRRAMLNNITMARRIIRQARGE